MPIRGKDLVLSVPFKEGVDLPVPKPPTIEITGFAPPDRLIEFINGNEACTSSNVILKISDKYTHLQVIEILKGLPDTIIILSWRGEIIYPPKIDE